MTFKKYKRIYRLGYEDVRDIFLNPEDKIIIQEKIDGANFRFMIKDGTIIFGSRSQELSEDNNHKYQKNFQRCIEFVRDTLLGVDLSNFNNCIFYGECCVKHSLSYDWDKIPPYLGFDIYNLELEEYVNYEQVKEIFDMINLPMVPFMPQDKQKELYLKIIQNKYLLNMLLILLRKKIRRHLEEVKSLLMMIQKNLLQNIVLIQE